MKRHSQIIPHFTPGLIPTLGRALLAGTAIASLTLAPSLAVAGTATKLAQAQTAQARPDTNKPGDDKKDDDKKSEDKKNQDKSAPPPKAQAAPPAAQPAAPKTADKPDDKPATPAKGAQPAAKTETKPEAKPEPPKAAAPQQQPSAAQKEAPKDAAKEAPKEESRRKVQGKVQGRIKDKSKEATSPPAKPQAPAAQQKPAAPATQTTDAPKSAPAAAQQDAAKSEDPAAVAAPTKARTSSEFIQKKGEKPSAGLDAVRRERREVRRDGRLIIQEPDRAIIREGNRTIVRHNEATRFAIDARGVHVERKGGTTTTIVTRPNGVRIITTTDARGHLLRRVRQTPDGKSIVIIDNTFAGAQRDRFFIEIAPPRLRGPRDRYIIDAGRARRERIYEVFVAPPVAKIDRRYTLSQVRYSEPLRNYMPRVDLDINFASGSWQLAASQVDELAVIADGIKRAVARNPREVFLIEGHTDAVGDDVDNLSLSDRRAEAVAVALTERFDVPPENLVTQGYGEEYLKVATDGPSQENRRVAVRRITPLIDQQVAQRGPRR